MAGRLVDDMASDLGVRPMLGETAQQLACRAAYSALRPWMQSYCLDDGYGGAYGIGGGAIVRKATLWLGNLAAVYPQVGECFLLGKMMRGGAGHGDGMRSVDVTHVRDLLVETGDLVRTRDGTYRCPVRHAVPVTPGWRAAAGWLDPTDTIGMRGVGPLSGMVRMEVGKSGVGAAVRTGVARTEDTQVQGARFEQIDESHTRMVMATSMQALAGRHARLWLEALTWPDWTGTGRQSKPSSNGAHGRQAEPLIIRSAYVPLAIALLEGARPA